MDYKQALKSWIKLRLLESCITPLTSIPIHWLYIFMWFQKKQVPKQKRGTQNAEKKTD